jgi:hypothetical protein
MAAASTRPRKTDGATRKIIAWLKRPHNWRPRWKGTRAARVVLTFGRWLLGRVSPKAGVIGVIFLFAAGLNSALGVFQGLRFQSSVVAAAGFFLVLVVAAAMIQAARAGDPESAKLRHDVSHRLRYATYWNFSGDKTGWDHQLSEAVDAIADAFTQATGVACRACVKELEYRGPDPVPYEWNDPAILPYQQFRTLFRSGGRTGSDDQWRPLNDSSAYQTLYLDVPSRTPRWYVVNDIEGEYRKATSRYVNTTRPPGQKDPLYNSTMSWPIRIDTRQARGRDSQRLLLVGFLSVDSLVTGIFNDSHGWLGAGFADGALMALVDPQLLADNPRQSSAAADHDQGTPPSMTTAGAPRRSGWPVAP